MGAENRTTDATKRRERRFRLTLTAILAIFLFAALAILAMPPGQEQVAHWNILLFGYTVVMLLAVVFLLFCAALLLIVLLTRDPQKMRRRLGGFVVLVVSSVIAVVILDVALSLFPSLQTSYTEPAAEFIKTAGWQPHETLGFKAKPNRRLSYRFKPDELGNLLQDKQLQNPLPTGEEEIDVCYDTDADGFFNDAVPAQADMVVMGDSFVSDMNIPLDEYWSALTGKRLGLSVYNAGHGGYSPPQEMIVLKEYALPKQPRIVLWGFFQGNDLREAEIFESFQKSGKPLFEFTQARQNPFPYNRPVFKLLMSLLGRLQGSRKYPPYPDPQCLSVGGVEKPVAFDRWAFYLLAQSREQTERSAGWKMTREAFSKGKEMCDKAGVRMVVVYFPAKLSVYGHHCLNAFDKEKILEFARPGLKELGDMTPEQFIEALRRNLNTQARMLEEYCQANGIEFINTQPTLKKSLERGEWPYYCYDTHMNIVGQRVVADVVCSYLNATEESTPSAGDTP